MQSNINPALKSSVDSTQYSLTVSSIEQVLGFGAVFLAAKYGFNPAVATNYIQYIGDTIIVMIPAAITLWHGARAIQGIIRKILVAITAPKPQNATVDASTVSA